VGWDSKQGKILYQYTQCTKWQYNDYIIYRRRHETHGMKYLEQD
jgi:hypothetical protein